MPVGNQATPASISQALTSMAVSLRNDCQNIANFQEFVVTLGLAGLEAIGFDSADAQTVLNMASYMNTIAGVYNGTATQGSEFNFGSALSMLWGGQ